MQTNQNELNVMLNNIHADAINSAAANEVFPLVDYVPESSVLHARKQWLKARQYLEQRGIEIKPLINSQNAQMKLI